MLLRHDPSTRTLVSSEIAELSEKLLRANRSHRLAASVRHPLSRALWLALERRLLPGIIQHHAHRKHWIEHHCRAAIGEGFTRLIILGAGFDTLGIRLSQQTPQVEIIEIDHPATQKAKRAIMAAPASPSIHLIPCDLANDQLPASLRQDPRKTIVIAEGLMMYLSPATIERLLHEVRALSSHSVHFIFSYIRSWPAGRPGFRPSSRVIDAWLAWREEPFTWATTPDALPDLLRPHGFTLHHHATPPDLAAGVTLQGENLVTCRTTPISVHAPADPPHQPLTHRLGRAPARPKSK